MTIFRSNLAKARYGLYLFFLQKVPFANKGCYTWDVALLGSALLLFHTVK